MPCRPLPPRSTHPWLRWPAQRAQRAQHTVICCGRQHGDYSAGAAHRARCPSHCPNGQHLCCTCTDAETDCAARCRVTPSFSPPPNPPPPPPPSSSTIEHKSACQLWVSLIWWHCVWCDALCNVSHSVSIWIFCKSLALGAVSTDSAALHQHVYTLQAGAGSHHL